MNQAQIDGITKARLTANIALAASGKPLYDDNAAYEAFVCESAGIDTLPDAAADSYAAQHAGKTVAELETELADALAKAEEAGAYKDDPTPVPTVAGVPQKVTMRQARLALLGAGMLAGVDAAIDAMSEPTRSAARIEWEYSSEVQRYNGFVAALGPALGMTDEQMDALFIAAAKL